VKQSALPFATGRSLLCGEVRKYLEPLVHTFGTKVPPSSTWGYDNHVLGSSSDSDGEHPGAVLRRLRHTAGRRVSQAALASHLHTSRAHVARLELHGFPRLTDEQLDRLEKAGDVIRPPFSADEISELRRAMRAVSMVTIKQADKAVRDIAAGTVQIFPFLSAATESAIKRTHRARPCAMADPFVTANRPKFLTGITEAVAAVEEDLKLLARQLRTGQPSWSGAKPDFIITYFGQHNLVEQARDPGTFRDAIREVLREGGTVELLTAPAASDASEDLIALVPVMISYLGQVPDQDGGGYRVRVIPELKHLLAYGICIAGDRALLITYGPDDRVVAIRTNDRDDVAALREILRPYWEDRPSIIEEAGRRTLASLTGQATEPSVGLPIENILTTVETEEGSRRLAKEGLSILNLPVAIHAWKWRAAELCTARWIPAELLEILQARAWELAAHGLRKLPHGVLDQYQPGSRPRAALEALDNYARGLQVRQAAWGDQLSRYDFWDACSKSALRRFVSTGELPHDEIPSACGYVADRGDIEMIIGRLIARLLANRNYHLALIDEPPFPQWFFFEIKAGHVVAQVFDRLEGQRSGSPAHALDENMLSVHINYAPIATAFAAWFDEHVLRAANDPPWQDNRSVANWLKAELERS
jgi:hypothetical protein